MQDRSHLALDRSGDPRRANRHVSSTHGRGYAELHCLSNFSFLRGASAPEELVARAAELDYAALAITDRNSLAGVVRAHTAARAHGLHLILGAEITPIDAPPLVLLAPDRPAYGRLARLITRGRLRSRKGECTVRLADILDLARGLIALLIPAPEWFGQPSGAGESSVGLPRPESAEAVRGYRQLFGDDLFLAAALSADVPDEQQLTWLTALANTLGIRPVATNNVHYHVPERRYLQDVLTCIREKCTLATAGVRLFANAERHLRPRDEIARRYAACPDMLERACAIAQRCTFVLDALRYEYPHELVPAGRTASAYLAELTWAGAAARYPPEQGGLPDKVRRLIEKELRLISELRYEHYFLTVWDLARFARQQGILCQGRGSAANSAVCYCLGVTAVDPARINLLFERFISRERNEPPDIDIDFEHERREEVFQYIYRKYGRERAGITAEVITYRPRSAVRDVGKALGLSLDVVDAVAKNIDWWTPEKVPAAALAAAGLDPQDRPVRMLVKLVRQIVGFPRHLSQHVGGFVITETPLCEIVPLENGAMPDRTFIEWNKDDIDALGILKVDCLALGILTALSKAFVMLGEEAANRTAPAKKRPPTVAAAPLPARCGSRPLASASGSVPPACLTDIPPEDPAVYDMICAADTIGVFQIESRAQMSMLPRLKPRCFYDLVIEVAIVRPGPIQGGMIHPYLRRRDGREPVWYPSDAVRGVLEKTLGVPLFQEQVMQLAVVAAGFTPGEADQLRRSMAAWRRSGEIDKFQTRLIKGLLDNGYSPQFAAQIFKQIRGFGEYGFPESHAASFALLVYVSAWLKRYYPAAFTGAILNSLPMGFYAPAQLVRDAQRHGVTVLGVDVNRSRWDCRLERADVRGASASHRCDHSPPPRDADRPTDAVLRLGFRLVRGLSAEKVKGIEAAQQQGPIHSIFRLAQRPDVSRETLLRLAAADAFRSLGVDRRQALWQILALDDAQQPLFEAIEPEEPTVALPEMPLDEVVVHDYDALGLSLNAHPLGLVRTELDTLRVMRSADLAGTRSGQRVHVAGLVTHRQRPATASGIVFLTLEDETGVANIIVKPDVWERDQAVGRSKSALLVEGIAERQGSVIQILARRLHDLSARIAPVRAASRDFH